jgi:hypothetical protein
MHDTIGRVDAIKVFRHLCAQKAARYWVRGIALHTRGPAIFHGNQNSAGIRAIVRTNGVDYLLHGFIIIWLWPEENLLKRGLSSKGNNASGRNGTGHRSGLRL